MGCHFCHEELFAILMILPFMRAFWTRARSLYHRAFGKPKCGHEEHTCHEHVDLSFNSPSNGNRVIPAGTRVTRDEDHVYESTDTVETDAQGVVALPVARVYPRA